MPEPAPTERRTPRRRLARLRAALLAVAALAAVPAAAPAQGLEPRLPAGAFADLADVAPDVVVDARYAGTHNFLGRRVPGYPEARCLLTRPAAEAVARVQEALRPRRLGLKVYDCYRPQRAVDAFVAWARDRRDVRMRPQFYPRVRKADLFEDGYIARRSGHSRGSTIDLTLVRLPPRTPERYRRSEHLVDCAAPARRRHDDGSLDMGTAYDCFDPLSHTYNGRVRGVQRRNRLVLKRAMQAAGFAPYLNEWWHFTLRGEPYPETRFDAPVARASLQDAPAGDGRLTPSPRPPARAR
jgi:D-alanyl-D-alanine dipeptidase